MDSFKQLIEEDIRSKLSSKGVALAGYAKDMLKAKIGDARSQGRLDLRNLVADLKDSLEYFLGHQGLEPSISSILSFIENVLGTKVPETTVTSLVPNRANLSVNSPNKEDIKQIFNLIIDDTKSLSPADLTRLVREIESYRRDSKDEQLIIEWMKYIRLNHKDVLELPEMEKLAPLGERIGDEYVEKVLVAIARNMLKNDAKAKVNQNNNTNDEKSTQDSSSEENEEAKDYSGKKVILTKRAVEVALEELGYTPNMISTMRQKDDQGNTLFARNFNEQEELFKTRFPVKTLNRITAVCFTYMAQLPTFDKQNFFDRIFGAFDEMPEYDNIDKNWFMQRHDNARSGQPYEVLYEEMSKKFQNQEVSSFLACMMLSAFLQYYDKFTQ